VRRIPIVIAAIATLAVPAAVAARDIRPGDMVLPHGFRIDVAAEHLASPTMVAFDDAGRMIVAESDYDDGGPAQVTRIEADGAHTVLATIPPEQKPLTAVAVHAGLVYVVTADQVSTIDTSGSLKPVITGLPGLGDHQADQLVFDGDTIVLSIGTMTNSSVVGPDNAVFGWLKDPARRSLHDVPCENVMLGGLTYQSDNPFGSGPVTTSAYSAFGTTQPAGTVIAGNPKCNGAVLRANLDGSNLQVVAWGFRNPYGLEIGADHQLYVTMHGFDARGSRPIENAPDCLFKVEEGAWYGWPDFACDGTPVSDARFRPPDGPQPEPVLASRPTGTPPAPLAVFEPHDATNGFAFSPGGAWGPTTDVFVAEFGDFTPATGTVDAPRGVKVVRVDTTTGVVKDFVRNDVPGEASKHGLGGLEHPSDVTFGPDGAMYVADWGVARISTDGLKLEPGSGVVWRVTPAAGTGSAAGSGADSGPTGPPIGPGLVIDLLLVALLLGGALLLALGPVRVASLPASAAAGIIAGLGMGLFMMLVVSTVLALPWDAAPRVLATMVMGRAAIADILDFELAPFLVGLVVLVVLSALLGLVFGVLLRRPGPRAVAAGLLYGLGVWMALEAFVLPLLFPLVSDKGFPPTWYAVSFGLFGLLLGAILGFAPARLGAMRPGGMRSGSQRASRA
jgi:glucose/arabinose dehydrogenase